MFDYDPSLLELILIFAVFILYNLRAREFIDDLQ